jgi:outer membrane protein OmpA-like peptidoglycan-associated protein
MGPLGLNDLSTNVWMNLIFFSIFVLFAFSFLGAFEIQLPNSWVNKMDKQAREIETALPRAQVERVGEGIKLVLGENAVRFDTNKSTLTTTAKANLDKLVPVFKSYADTDIVIYGYTDSTGSAEYNLNLSQQRANSVEKYLESKGINMSRFKMLGMGIADPIATNDTPEGRSQNRRVEFAITANEKMVQDAQKEAGK